VITKKKKNMKSFFLHPYANVLIIVIIIAIISVKSSVTDGMTLVDIECEKLNYDERNEEDVSFFKQLMRTKLKNHGFGSSNVINEGSNNVEYIRREHHYKVVVTFADMYQGKLTITKLYIVNEDSKSIVVTIVNETKPLIIEGEEDKIQYWLNRLSLIVCESIYNESNEGAKPMLNNILINRFAVLSKGDKGKTHYISEPDINWINLPEDLKEALVKKRIRKDSSVKYCFEEDSQIKVKGSTESEHKKKMLLHGDIEFSDLSGDIKYVISGEITLANPFNKSTIYLFKKDTAAPGYGTHILKNYSLDDDYINQLATKIIKKWDKRKYKESLLE
jgi:hypothetical protein